MFAMKLGRAAFLTFAILGTVGAAPARASHDEKMPSSHSALTKMDPMDVMHLMDADKNGYVTREEFVKFQEALFEKIDKNRDRKLAPAEFTDQG